MISAILRTPILAGIGRISYSVYLVHWTLIASFSLLSASHQLKPDEVLCLVVASLALGYALHHSVEARFRHGPPGCDDNAPERSPGRALFIFSSTGAMLCAAAYGVTLLADIKASATHAKSPATSTAPTTGFNASEAARWEWDLCKVGKSDWRPRLRPRPGMNTSIANRHAIHLTYRPAKPARARMLLFGDSHAETVKPLALRMALEKGYELDSFTMPACVGLLTPPLLARGVRHNRDICLNEQKYWRDRIERTPYDLVLLATWWYFLFEDVKYGEFTVKPRIILFREGEEPKTRTLHRRFKKLINETVGIVLRSGARLVLFGQAPEVGKNIRGCLNLPASKKAVAQGRVPKVCFGATRRDVLRRARFMDTLFEKMAYADRRITAVTATKYFCDDFEEEYCKTVYGEGCCTLTTATCRLPAL